MQYCEQVKVYRDLVHEDVENCRSMDTLDLIHKLLVQENAAETPQKAKRSGAAISPLLLGMKVAAR